MLDFGGNGSEEEILGLENMLRICLFFNHASLIMVISSMLIKIMVAYKELSFHIIDITKLIF